MAAYRTKFTLSIRNALKDIRVMPINTQKGTMGQDAEVNLPKDLEVVPSQAKTKVKTRVKSRKETSAEVVRTRRPWKQTVPILRNKESGLVMVDLAYCQERSEDITTVDDKPGSRGRIEAKVEREAVTPQLRQSLPQIKGNKSHIVTVEIH